MTSRVQQSFSKVDSHKNTKQVAVGEILDFMNQILES